MDLLLELLSINNEHQQLNEDIQLLEDLGTLQVIDKHLLKGMIGSIHNVGWNRKDSGRKDKLRDSLGRHSNVETVQDKSGDYALEHLKAEGDTIAIIIEYDGKQVLAVVAKNRSINAKIGYKETEGYGLIANPKFFDVISKEDFTTAHTTQKRNSGPRGGTYSEVDSDFTPDRMIEGTSATVLTKIKKILKMVFDAAKTNKVSVKTLIIKRDTERSKKSGERAAGRRGAIPLPTGNAVAIGPSNYSTYQKEAQNFFKELGNDLKTRLESFKAGKAKSFDTPNELLKALIDEGYFDKLKFMGFTYKLEDNRINFKELKHTAATGEKPRYSSDLSYIEYKIQSGTPEMDKLNTEFKAIREKMTYEEYAEVRENMLPPSELKIMLKLDGGKIIPEAIDIGKDRAWVY